jgi:hypothetical protein
MRVPGLEWIGVVVDSPAGGRPVLVWYEPSTDKVIDIRVTEPGLREAPGLFVRATQHPAVGEPRIPARIRVADPVLARILDPHLIGVEVVVGDISEARDMVASLNEHMIRNEPVMAEVAPEVYARLFRAAAALYRAKPWAVLPADEWIAVDCEALGIAGGALSVVGQRGESHGFTLCRTLEDATTWLDAGERRVLGKPYVYPDEFFMFSYSERRELDPEDVAEVKRQRWEVASPAAYPSLTVVDHGEGRLPTASEIAGVSTMIEGLTAMLRDEPDLETAWDLDPVEWEGEVDGTRVRFAAPLEVSEPPADPGDASLDILDEHGRIDDLRFDRYQTALMMRLAARDEIPDEVLAAAEMLVAFAAQFHGATFGKITSRELEALLLETVPAQLAVEADEAGRIVAAARELMRFAGDELGSPTATGALAMLDGSFEQKLARELANPANYGPSKQLVMAGIAAGFDMSTEQGVAEFVEAFARAQKKPKKAKPKAKAKAKPKPKKPATKRARRR